MGVSLEQRIENNRRVVKGILTAREHQVLMLTAQGLPQREIADAIGMSTWAVSDALRYVTERFGARDRQHCLRIAYERGLLDDVEPPPDPDRPLFEKVGLIYRATNRPRD